MLEGWHTRIDTVLVFPNYTLRTIIYKQNANHALTCRIVYDMVGSTIVQQSGPNAVTVMSWFHLVLEHCTYQQIY